jgi:Tfp pilus assembly protein PilO
MNLFFLILLVIMLLVFGYAQLQKGVVRTLDRISLSEEEEIEFR